MNIIFSITIISGVIFLASASYESGNLFSDNCKSKFLDKLIAISGTITIIGIFFLFAISK